MLIITIDVEQNELLDYNKISMPRMYGRDATLLRVRCVIVLKRPSRLISVYCAIYCIGLWANMYRLSAAIIVRCF